MAQTIRGDRIAVPIEQSVPYGADEQGFASLYAIQRRARGTDVAAFATTYPLPALVPDSKQLDTDEPDTGDEASGIQLLTTTVGGLGVLRYLNKVGFLSKRPGNPYAHLISVGRSATNDLVVALDTVSKVHGYFVRDGDAWLFNDRGSTNGSWLNERRLTNGQPARLSDGDRLRLGHDMIFIFMTPPALHQHARQS